MELSFAGGFAAWKGKREVDGGLAQRLRFCNGASAGSKQGRWQH